MISDRLAHRRTVQTPLTETETAIANFKNENYKISRSTIQKKYKQYVEFQNKSIFKYQILKIVECVQLVSRRWSPTCQTSNFQ